MIRRSSDRAGHLMSVSECRAALGTPLGKRLLLSNKEYSKLPASERLVRASSQEAPCQRAPPAGRVQQTSSAGPQWSSTGGQGLPAAAPGPGYYDQSAAIAMAAMQAEVTRLRQLNASQSADTAPAASQQGTGAASQRQSAKASPSQSLPSYSEAPPVDDSGRRLSWSEEVESADESAETETVAGPPSPSHEAGLNASVPSQTASSSGSGARSAPAPSAPPRAFGRVPPAPSSSGGGSAGTRRVPPPSAKG